MKKFALMFCALVTLSALAHAGPETYSGKEMKQVVPQPCPEWYADTEWNISLWGTYAFNETDNERSDPELADDDAIFGTYDRFLGGDHAWGGGADVKYFFLRYFGIGIEGFALAAHGTHARFDEPPDDAHEEHYEPDHHGVGAVLGTFTLRYPFHCSRFSPYIWGGGGGIFGGHNDVTFPHPEFGTGVAEVHEESRFIGQFGGGLEIRFTRHIGWMGDFSWNILEGGHNNFGMARSGINISF